MGWPAMAVPGQRKKSRNLVWLVALVIATAAPAKADGSDTPTDRLSSGASLADMKAVSLAWHPSVAAARARWEAAVEKIRTAEGLPDPALSLTLWPAGNLSDASVSKTEVMLSQAIPWPGMLDSAAQVAGIEARLAGMAADRAVRDLVRQVRESFHELAYIRAAREIARQNVVLLDRLILQGEAAAAQQKLPLSELFGVQAQSAQAGYDLQLLAELESAETLRLNSLLGRPDGAPIGPLVPEPSRPVNITRDEVLRRAMEGRLEIREARLGREKAAVETRMARLANRPEFMTGISWEYIEGEGMAKDESMIGLQVGLTLPLWPGKRAGRVAGAAAEARMAEADEQAMMAETRSMVADLWFRLKNAERLVALYREYLLPRATAALEQAETRFREGIQDYAGVAETQAAWANFRLAQARAEADQGKYRAALESLAGSDLAPAGEVKP